jgi:hypothetical protein
MSKQSSIDWLFDQLCSEKFSWIKGSNDKIYFDRITSDLLQQAKAMHKNEIEGAWYNSLTKADYLSGNEYYKGTFGNEEVL